MSTWKLGIDSYHKLIVWFADGNTRTIYSIDWKSKFSHQRDANLGIQRLRKCIARWGHLALVVEIYENIYGTQNGAIVERYEQGMKTELNPNRL